MGINTNIPQKERNRASLDEGRGGYERGRRSGREGEGCEGVRKNGRMKRI
jgi:hypothetical protein